MSLFSELHDFGIIDMLTIKDLYFIHEDEIGVVEKVIRMQRELNLNLEGVDTVFNLLDKINELQTELNNVKNRLHLYEE
jgi:uncharacterized protein (DUF1778 family)